jgi:DNA-binding transcriptional LysR family regulator
MLSIEDLRFFSVVAGSSSLAAAARMLDVTAPAVSQRLQYLETRLRVRLVDRSARRLTLTAEGEYLLQRCGSVLHEIDTIEGTLASRRGVVGGHLRVAAPFGFGRRFIAPVIARFRDEHPETTVSLILSDNPLRLDFQSWDLLVHIGELKDSSLMSQRLAPNERVVCAAPSYLRRRGTPLLPEDLRQHDCIALRENDEDVTLWRFADAAGAVSTVRTAASMASNDGGIVHDWALSGHGVIVRSEWNVADDLRSGALVPLLPGWHLPPADVTAILGERAQRAARTTRFLELLRRSLAHPPWRDVVHQISCSA